MVGIPRVRQGHPCEYRSLEVRPLVPLWFALLVAAAAGPILDAGFPGRAVWPAAFVAVALMLITLIGRRAGASLVVGFVAGWTFYQELIESPVIVFLVGLGLTGRLVSVSSSGIPGICCRLS